MVLWTRVVNRDTKTTLQSEIIFPFLICHDVESLQELVLYSTCNHEIMYNFTLDIKEGVSATLTIVTHRRVKIRLQRVATLSLCEQAAATLHSCCWWFSLKSIFCFELDTDLWFCYKSTSPYLARYILETKMEQRLVSWLYIIYCRGWKRTAAVCLTVHRPCNSLFILWCLKMGFYSQSFYFQIKQTLVLCKPVKRVSKRIFQARSQSTQTTQQSVKRVLEPESDRLLSRSQSAVCSSRLCLTLLPCTFHTRSTWKSVKEGSSVQGSRRVS